MILAIDPGNVETAYVWIGEDYTPTGDFGKQENKYLLAALRPEDCKGIDVIIEMVASYGMPVGREVFETCVWIGRFTEGARRAGARVHYIYRKDVKTNLCHDSRAKDSNIQRALIDRFAQFDLKRGKGTKKKPDWFYGFADDVWAAYAVGVTYLDVRKR
jgi:hypothetical protein